MAGSYRNITQTDGTPKENFGVGSSLDNEGDIIEALQKCYGMIWWLAIMLCEQHTSRRVAIRDSVLACIKLAETNAGVGRERGESGQ
jgi:hypothetical protein